MLARNALTGISHQMRLLPGVAPLLVHSSAHLLEVRACRGWQRVLRDHLRRTECHVMDDPYCIAIFTTVDGAKVSCDSSEEWGKSRKANGGTILPPAAVIHPTRQCTGCLQRQTQRIASASDVQRSLMCPRLAALNPAMQST